MFNYFPRRIRTVHLPTRHPSPRVPNRSPCHFLPRPASRSTHSTSRAAPNADKTSSSLWARFPIAPVALPIVAATLPHYAGRACSLLGSAFPLSNHTSPSRWPYVFIVQVLQLHRFGHASQLLLPRLPITLAVFIALVVPLSPLFGPLHRCNLLARLTPQRLEQKTLSLPNNSQEY